MPTHGPTKMAKRGIAGGELRPYEKAARRLAGGLVKSVDEGLGYICVRRRDLYTSVPVASRSNIIATMPHSETAGMGGARYYDREVCDSAGPGPFGGVDRTCLVFLDNGGGDVRDMERVHTELDRSG